MVFPSDPKPRPVLMFRGLDIVSLGKVNAFSKHGATACFYAVTPNGQIEIPSRGYGNSAVTTPHPASFNLISPNTTQRTPHGAYPLRGAVGRFGEKRKDLIIS